MDAFHFDETYLSQIPALQVLVNLGFEYKLDGVANIAWDDDALARLRVVVKFIEDAVEILDKKGVPDYLRLRVREKSGRQTETFYDHLAGMIFEVILAASAVTSPNGKCWWIQHNTVWGELFNFNNGVFS